MDKKGKTGVASCPLVGLCFPLGKNAGMYPVHEDAAAPSFMSEADRNKVREQLNRLLQTHHFNNSRRYPPLLRFIVEETLAGRGEFLKERLLGIKVFDRPADYDTATDPIVRVTIAEIRKRIAQYYHDEEHDSEIRIELQPGRYAPEFRRRGSRNEIAVSQPWPAEVSPQEAMAYPAMEAPTLPVIFAAQEPERITRMRSYVVAGLLLLALVCAGMTVVHYLRPNATRQMWGPLVESPQSILFCLPTDVGVKRGPAGDFDPGSQPAALHGNFSSPSGPTFLQWEALGQNVVFSDMMATLRITDVFAMLHHDYRVRLNNTTTLEDLRQGPEVLIGGLDNQWTMRALTPLPFHFAGSDEDRYWITDAKNPDSRQWSVDLKLKYGAVTRDYAIIARLHNEQTGQPQMIVAGIGMSGTAAAGEFLADPRRMEELRQRIGRGFGTRDFEVVLSTAVVNGIAGAPKIVAVAVL